MEPGIRIEISGERAGVRAGREMLNMLDGKFYAHEVLMKILSMPLLKFNDIQIVGESSSRADSGSVDLG